MYNYRYGPNGLDGPYVQKKGKIAKAWVGLVTVRTRGVAYIKAITDSVGQQLLRDLLTGQTWMQNVTIDGEMVKKKKMAITFRWDGEDLVLDNENTLLHYYHMEYACFGFDMQMTLTMKWFMAYKVGNA